MSGKFNDMQVHAVLIKSSSEISLQSLHLITVERKHVCTPTADSEAVIALNAVPQVR
jgi:hypothetical protein